jgi:hypothetical protein
MSRWTLFRLMLIISLLVSAGAVFARDFLNDSHCVVPAETTIHGTLFVLCQDLHIDGTVYGDVVGGALRTEINGQIYGNVYMLSSQMDVRGRVTKDLHFGGVVLRLNPPYENVPTEMVEGAGSNPQWIGGSVKAFSLSTTVFENCIIDDGIINAGYQLVVQGDVRNEITFWGSAFLIDGLVAGDVYASVGNPEAESRTLETLLIPFKFDVQLLNPGLIISENAHLKANLQYTGPAAAEIEGDIDGEAVYDELPQAILPTLEEPGSLSVYFAQVGREFTTLLVLGAVGVLAVPSFLDAPLRNLRTRPFSSFSVGMLSFLLSFPVVMIVLILSGAIIFLLNLINLDGLVVAVGIVLGLVNLGGVSLFYFVAIFVARALVGLALGRFIMRVIYRHREGTLWLLAEQAIGLLVLALVVSLPVLGLLFNAAALFMGLGTILNVLVMQFRRWREVAPVPVPTWYVPSPAVTRRHPTVTDRQRAKIIPLAATVDDDEDFEDEEIDAIAPVPLPPPAAADPYPLVGPGMTNLPDGFDFRFFADNAGDDETDDE